MADPILKMAGLKLFYDNNKKMISKIRLLMLNAANYF